MIAHSDEFRNCRNCNITGPDHNDCHRCGRKRDDIISADMHISNFVDNSKITDSLIVNQETIDEDDCYNYVPVKEPEEPSKYNKPTALEKQLRKQAYKAIQKKHGRR